MKHSECPNSPKHGYEFDGQESNVVRVRVAHRCDGGRRSRGALIPGVHAEGCTGIIAPGEIAVTTIDELFVSDTYACVACATLAGSLGGES